MHVDEVIWLLWIMGRVRLVACVGRDACSALPLLDTRISRFGTGGAGRLSDQLKLLVIEGGHFHVGLYLADLLGAGESCRSVLCVL